MQHELNSCDKVYTITYLVDSYYPYQWEVCLLVDYITEPDTF